MVRRRVTMQDIADACGLSRNTVSKVFNSRGSVPEATQRFVLDKAKELGYNQFSETEARAASSANIVILTHSKPMNNSFGSSVISSFSDCLCRDGFNLKMYGVSSQELENRKLPPFLDPERIDGILCIELFDKDYMEMICSLGLPTVCIDAFASISFCQMNCDFVSMENVSSSILLTRRLIAAGASTIGFVGDITHCSSFRERYDGFILALNEAHIPFERSFCILDNDSEPYGNPDWYLEKLDLMPHLPDAFVCANDFQAINLMAGLKKRGIDIPKEVMVVGFDGTPESSVSEPSLSTAFIPGDTIGRLAAETLESRIKNPDLPYCRIYVRTNPVFRNSTREPVNYSAIEF